MTELDPWLCAPRFPEVCLDRLPTAQNALHIAHFEKLPYLFDDYKIRRESPSMGARAAQRTADRRPHRPATAFLRARSIAATVCSISASEWAIDTKPASKWDGARNTPSSSMAWKYLAYSGASDCLADS